MDTTKQLEALLTDVARPGDADLLVENVASRVGRGLKPHRHRPDRHGNDYKYQRWASTLFKAVSKLANENPSLRKHLVPVLRKHAGR